MKEIKNYPNAKHKNVRLYDHDRPFLEVVEDGIRVRQATEQGYAFCPVGGVFDISYPSSRLRRARVQGNGTISPALTCGIQNTLVIYEGTEDE